MVEVLLEKTLRLDVVTSWAFLSLCVFLKVVIHGLHSSEFGLNGPSMYLCGFVDPTWL